jgi:hypothetical protein
VFLQDALPSVRSSILRPLETYKVKDYRVQAFISCLLRAGNVVDMVGRQDSQEGRDRSLITSFQRVLLVLVSLLSFLVGLCPTRNFSCRFLIPGSAYTGPKSW